MTPELIRRLAREATFQADQLEKVLRLRQLLSEFAVHPALKSKLVLKGGTALNVFHIPLPRLSVDIDLNYVGAADQDAMRTDRPEIEKAIRQIAETLGYRIQAGAAEYALFSLYLVYRNHLGRDDRIEVEVNYLHRTPALDPVMMKAVQLGDEAPCEYLVLAAEELLAGKYKAMIDRTHPRDLYDLYRFEAGRPTIDRELLRSLTLLLCGTLNNPVATYTLERCLRTTMEDLERQLYPLLRADDRPTLETMQNALRGELQAVLDLAARSEFLADLDRGIYSPTKLFPNRPDLAERIARYPALLWKADNVAHHRKGRQE